MNNDENKTEAYIKGEAIRRNVLGDEHVDRAITGTKEFKGAFQEFITRYAWGEIWDRPGLDKKTRSLLTLSMLIALGHDSEFEMHIRAAINNGVTVEEIKELLMHSALYCGLPAANHGFKLAEGILKELGKL
ncbi:MAG: 4-carboxymuconolactone decarboxylase [Verrucomicrobia bacterium]|nr:4-carboxymuconolactone decarboxylase [Verrucomicrobiota bacterium]MDA1066674.1 4-carboxymuconolactone decarboxylase [Verrucomicrobiota bacterium]